MFFMNGGVVLGVPRVLVRTENLAIMVAAVIAYGGLGANWWLFALLFLVPDIFMIGYLRGPRLGAAIYNAGHWYGLPVALAASGFFAHSTTASIGLIWAAHIGFDRALGFGLKYPDSFKASHLTIAKGV
jgi:hypothetical protein